MKRVFIYTNYYCQACRRLKAFLQGHNVTYEYVDLDRLNRANYQKQVQKAFELSGSRSIPIVQVDEEVRVGFDPEWLAKVLDLPDAEMPPPFPRDQWVGDPALEPRRLSLRTVFEPVIRALGYKFTPHVHEAEFLLEQVARNEAAFGMPFCPCKMLSGSRDQDLQIVCPCIPFHRKHFDSMKRCWCGLFVHEDVDDPDLLKQVLEDRGS